MRRWKKATVLVACTMLCAAMGAGYGDRTYDTEKVYAAEKKGSMIFPESSERKLTESDLRGHSAKELRIAKNEIYARHGRKFNSADLKQYFEAQSWYHGTIAPSEFREGILSKTEEANVILIDRYLKNGPSGSETSKVPETKPQENKPAAEPEKQTGSTSKEEYQNGTEIGLDENWKYAGFSAIHSGKAVLYRSEAKDRKNLVVTVNAGHGTKGGSSVKTYCHPDKTPKVTGGTTGKGATKAIAVSGGMTFRDGTPESKVTLAMAKILKEMLLEEGYDVLMIRESDDVQLDNIARTVIANNVSDCHIALHWDATEKDKGAFYMSVPKGSYREMEPVRSNWKKHNSLGESLIAGLKDQGVKIFSGGSMAMDLTQTSYSTIPSVDIELGDKISDHSEKTLKKLSKGLVAGVSKFFGK